MKRSQSATELAIVIGIMMGVLVVFVAAIFSRYYEFAKIETNRNLQDVANYIESEMNFAIKSEPGLNRTFWLPSKIAGLDYKISVANPNEKFSIITIEYTNGQGSPITIPFDYKINANAKTITSGLNKLNKSTLEPETIQINYP
jgi:hypothetical protein